MTLPPSDALAKALLELDSQETVSHSCPLKVLKSLFGLQPSCGKTILCCSGRILKKKKNAKLPEIIQNELVRFSSISLDTKHSNIRILIGKFVLFLSQLKRVWEWQQRMGKGTDSQVLPDCCLCKLHPASTHILLPGSWTEGSYFQNECVFSIRYLSRDLSGSCLCL